MDSKPVQDSGPRQGLEVLDAPAAVDVDRTGVPIDSVAVQIILGYVSLSELLEPVAFPSGSISSSMRAAAQS